MTLKDIDFSVKMYGTTPIIQSNYDVAYTGDESSINLRFAVTDEPELEGATAIVHLKKVALNLRAPGINLKLTPVWMQVYRSLSMQ